MITVEIKNSEGSGSGSCTVDPKSLGGFVKKRLMHDAVVMYHAAQRRGTACTKSRGEVAGSTKKMYRQKGTGRARAGNRKSGTRRGGGAIFGPRPRSYRYPMPKKARRAARRSALLGKLLGGKVSIVESFGLERIGTKAMTALLERLDLAGESILVVTAKLDQRVYRSARNIPGVHVQPLADLNAREILSHQVLLFDRAAFEALLGEGGAVEQAVTPGSTEESEG